MQQSNSSNKGNYTTILKMAVHIPYILDNSFLLPKPCDKIIQTEKHWQLGKCNNLLGLEDYIQSGQQGLSYLTILLWPKSPTYVCRYLQNVSEKSHINNIKSSNK